jgi:hypothetical protein
VAMEVAHQPSQSCPSRLRYEDGSSPETRRAVDRNYTSNVTYKVHRDEGKKK